MSRPIRNRRLYHSSSVDVGNPGGRGKVRKVLHEFKEGRLRSSSGDLVTSSRQAVAIALSEAGLSKKKRRK